jgi:hypothetical protein
MEKFFINFLFSFITILLLVFLLGFLASPLILLALTGNPFWLFGLFLTVPTFLAFIVTVDDD